MPTVTWKLLIVDGLLYRETSQEVKLALIGNGLTMKKDLETCKQSSGMVLHCLTQNGQRDMRVDYQTSMNSYSNIHYSHFSIGNATEEYPLMVTGYIGEGTDKFAPQNNIKLFYHQR